MTGGNWRVRREYATLAHSLHRFVEGNAVALDDLARQFERQKRGMTFIEMKYRWSKPELLQQTNAANAQHHLLHQARFPIAAIEVARDQSIDFIVLRNVRIKQVKLHAANICTPDSRRDGAATHYHLNQQRLALFIVDALQRQLVNVIFAIFLFLQIVAAQALTEISEAIKQTESNQRHIQIARGLQMIAGENAKSARVERQRIVHAKLSAEIRDGCLRANVRRQRQLRPGPAVA